MRIVDGALRPLQLLENIHIWKMREKDQAHLAYALLPLTPPEADALRGWASAFAGLARSAGDWRRCADADAADRRGVAAWQAQAERLLQLGAAQSRAYLRCLDAVQAAHGADPAAHTLLAHLKRESARCLGACGAPEAAWAPPSGEPQAAAGPWRPPAAGPAGGAALAQPPPAFRAAAAQAELNPSATGEGSWSAALALSSGAGTAAGAAAAGPQGSTAGGGPPGPTAAAPATPAPPPTTAAPAPSAHMLGPHTNAAGVPPHAVADTTIAAAGAAPGVQHTAYVASPIADLSPAAHHPSAEAPHTGSHGLSMPLEAAHAYEAASPGSHVLPPLPYAYDALEPFLDEATLQLHHATLHRSTVDGLNRAERKFAEAQNSGSAALIMHWERELAAYSAEHELHTLLWRTLHPQGGRLPTSPLAEAISRTFGGFERFRRHFAAQAEPMTSGGWALLIWNAPSRRLEIAHTARHPPRWGAIPLLPLDVSEHAYYLKYGPKRAAYIEAWWRVINWPYVNERFTAARQLHWPSV